SHALGIEGDDPLVLPDRRLDPLERSFEQGRQARADRELPGWIVLGAPVCPRVAARAAVERGLERGGGQIPAAGLFAQRQEALDRVASLRCPLDLTERLDRRRHVAELLLLQRRETHLESRAPLLVHFGGTISADEALHGR